MKQFGLKQPVLIKYYDTMCPLLLFLLHLESYQIVLYNSLVMQNYHHGTFSVERNVNAEGFL